MDIQVQNHRKQLNVSNRGIISVQHYFAINQFGFCF